MQLFGQGHEIGACPVWAGRCDAGLLEQRGVIEDHHVVPLKRQRQLLTPVLEDVDQLGAGVVEVVIELVTIPLDEGIKRQSKILGAKELCSFGGDANNVRRTPPSDKSQNLLEVRAPVGCGEGQDVYLDPLILRVKQVGELAPGNSISRRAKDREGQRNRWFAQDGEAAQPFVIGQRRRRWEGKQGATGCQAGGCLCPFGQKDATADRGCLVADLRSRVLFVHRMTPSPAWHGRSDTDFSSSLETHVIVGSDALSR